MVDQCVPVAAAAARCDRRTPAIGGPDWKASTLATGIESPAGLSDVREAPWDVTVSAGAHHFDEKEPLTYA